MDNRATMKALVFKGPKEVQIEEIERFEPEEGEVRVRVRAAAVCTTERRIFSGELKLPFPIIGGHETSGIIDWVDDKKEHLARGEHVILDSMIRCSECYYCVRGYSNLCLNLRAMRNNYLILGGGFAEYVVLPRTSVFRFSTHLSFEEASLAEPVACCLRSVKRAELAIGDTVAIIGTGTMGAIHLLLSRLRGARTIVCDINDERLQLARKLGAEWMVNPTKDDPAAVVKEYTGGRGADVVFVTASSKEAGAQALVMVGPRGRVILYASTHPPATLELDWNKIHYREIMVAGTEGKTPEDLRQAAALLSSGSINVKPLISRVIRLEELPEELGRRPAGEVQRVVVKL